MNSVNITGRLGSDIELRSIPSGKSVAEVNLAVDDGFGENKKTAWIGVTIWGVTAETAAKYLSKGSLVGFTGRLSQDEWEDKQTGKKQRKTKVTCETMTLLDSKRDAPRQDAHNQAKANGYQPQRSANQNGAAPPAKASTADDFDDDSDIPF